MRNLIAAIVLHASAVLFSAGVIASAARNVSGTNWGNMGFIASAVVLAVAVGIAVSGGRPPDDHTPPPSGPVDLH